VLSAHSTEPRRRGAVKLGLAVKEAPCDQSLIVSHKTYDNSQCSCFTASAVLRRRLSASDIGHRAQQIPKSRFSEFMSKWIQSKRDYAMDIEFHYYMTYLIAARAGFSPADATVIAHSAQSVDVNHILISVNPGGDGAFNNSLSQTMDITRPHDDLRIYPVFHFIPGDPNAPTAARKDGQTDPWTTTPNSRVAISMLQNALDSRDIYRIGVSAHGYVDTWAHQNFVGKDSPLNKMPAVGNDGEAIEERVLDLALAIGHGAAKHQPDEPGLVWLDGRLVASNETVVNRARFLDAAKHLFIHLARWCRSAVSDAELEAEAASLCADLDSDIGPQDDANDHADLRIQRYRARGATLPYGGIAMEIYDDNAWFNAALNESREGIVAMIRERTAKALGDYGDVVMNGGAINCTWRDVAHRQDTDWLKFQMAVKAHLDECWAILVQENLPGIAA